jgi:regulator of protease activity HflC (stomatin/prohibitin superfamily)
MERSIQKNALTNLLVLLGVGVAAFATARYANSFAGTVASVYLGLGVLVALVSGFQIRLAERERLERLDLDELARGQGRASLFETSDAETFPARQARELFEKWFVPGFTVVLFLLEGAAAWLLWKWLAPQVVGGAPRALISAGIYALCGLVLFIVGRFAVAFSRVEENRLLRPAAGYLLLGAYLCFTAAIGVGLGEAGLKTADLLIGRVLVGVLGLLAVETMVALILEIYRPRVKGKAVRPVYESRLVSLMGQPEGLITTAAQTLDYQFGFKVSDTWFYRFLEGALGWLILLQVGVLLLSTCVVFIDPGEQAILERFGRPVATLDPGGRFKLPWPLDRVYRFQTEQVQSFIVGQDKEEERANSRVVLWTVGHGTEENFMVASRAPAQAATTATGTPEAAARRSPPVSLLVVSIPVQFQITNVMAWAYTDAEPAQLLRNLATHEVVKYLVSVDLAAVMARGRFEAGEALRDRIQQAATARRLGVRVAFVGLEDIHPPVKVAAEYEKVIATMQMRQARVLSANAAAIRTNTLAEARAVEITNRAYADRLQRESGALAQAALFTNQVAASKASPAVYAQRAYLGTFARSVAGARKYLVLTTNTTDVIQFDLQDKIRTDLLEGLTVPPVDKK